ncbi:thioredoxin-like protein [Pavlovales sp. CCMP2436]|nr:thioredoxin-like protein [Pavlovales sp. CCMP2436]
MMAVEKQLDSELDKMENLNEDDFARIRRGRIEQMKEAALEKEQWRRNDHGTLTMVSDQKDFFDSCKKSKRLVCLFYRDANKWCDVLATHCQVLAEKHMECKFLKVNAEKSPFLVERLNVYMMPTLVCVKEGNVHVQLNGLDDIDPTGKFETASLEFVLHGCGMLDETPLVDKIMDRQDADDDDLDD